MPSDQPENGHAIPKGTSHITIVGKTKTLCGRSVGGTRVHRSWPICKTCQKINTCSIVTWWDSDGWSTSTPGRSGVATGTYSTNVVLNFGWWPHAA